MRDRASRFPQEDLDKAGVLVLRCRYFLYTNTFYGLSVPKKLCVFFRAFQSQIFLTIKANRRGDFLNPSGYLFLTFYAV